jgi:predicted dehydrogenase
MSELSRRQFLHDSLLTAAAAAAAGSVPTLFAAEAVPASKGPNDKLGFCCIGVNGRGKSHLGAFQGNDSLNTEVVAICDVDSDVGYKSCESVGAKQGGRKPTYYQDIRKALEDPAVDCVSIATPNHWHALAAIWAMQHGKDVYVEKPVCHNISEGQRMVEAARKYNKICQTGTQSRSTGGTQQTIAYMKSGKLGEITLSRGLCYKGRGSIGPKGEYAVPASIAYDLWTGPAPFHEKSRYNVSKQGPVHYNWHWFWDYGNGDLGNQGIHQMDIARWGLGVDQLANGVITYGGRFGYEDAGETPNTEVAIFDYGPKTLVFEVRGLRSSPLKDVHIGNIFEGTEGYAVITDSYSHGTIFDKDMKVVQKFNGGGSHFDNFVKAVRSRKKEDLNAEIHDGFLSSSLCHLGNISYRLGQKASTSETLERAKSFKMSDNAQETLDRTVAHLEENKVKLDGNTMFQCGEYLKFDPQTEKFATAKANEFLTREYRAPFVVPTAGNV